jgi:ubiquinone/menaquinone biosynthesis C-methylase UbiE
MFSETAFLYDLIYSKIKNYEEESTRVAALIRSEHPAARTVLDVACGTAEHARLLHEEHGFDVDGIDLDPNFVAIARSKLPGSTIYEGNMVSFALPKRYDVVLCLFSSIGYVRTLENVRAALECFRRHLNEGAILVVEPWFSPDAFHPGHVSVDRAEGAGVNVCRMAYSTVIGNVSRIEFEYLIGRPSGIMRASEVHELGLFTVAEMHECFASTGFTVMFDPKGIFGRGLYVARCA